jgi:hypothetical protein
MSALDLIRPNEWDSLKKDFYKDRTASQEFNDYANGCPEECTDGGNIDKPAHYNNGSIEAIEYIKQQTGEGFKDYLYGNAIKYMHRHRYKGKPVEDLRKAQWYITRMIQEECNVR